MRGSNDPQIHLSLVTPEQVVPADHPIRLIKPIVDVALRELDPVFDAMYSDVGRPSIPPENLLKACLLMAFYSVRSERQFCERLRYDLLFKWFLDLNLDDEVWDQSTFAKNRERLLQHDVARRFFDATLGAAKQQRLLSRDHFTVDGTLLEARASLKSLTPKPNLGGQRKPRRRRGAKGGGGRNPEVDWRGEKRSNQTHFSATESEARLARKGNSREAQAQLRRPRRDGESQWPGGRRRPDRGQRVRRAGCRLAHAGPGSAGVGTEAQWPATRASTAKTSSTELGYTPHIAQNINKQRGSNIDRRTTSPPGYAVSQRLRKRVEEIFGWWKTVGGGRKLRYVGLKRNLCR